MSKQITIELKENNSMKLVEFIDHYNSVFNMLNDEMRQGNIKADNIYSKLKKYGINIESVI